MFVCEKDPVKEKKGQQLVNVAYIVKRRNKTESSRKFECMIKDTLVTYIQTKIQGGKKILRKKE